MKKKKHTFNFTRIRRLSLLVGGIILIITAGIGLYWYITQHHKSVNPSEGLSTPNRPVGETNYSKPNNDEKNPKLDRPSEPQQPQHNNTTTQSSKPISVVITHASGVPLRVGVMVNELLPNGTCTLNMTKKDTAPIMQTVDIFNGPHYTTCKGFTITEITGGTWQLTVNIRSGDRSGTAKQEITL